MNEKKWKASPTWPVTLPTNSAALSCARAHCAASSVKPHSAVASTHCRRGLPLVIRRIARFNDAVISVLLVRMKAAENTQQPDRWKLKNGPPHGESACELPCVKGKSAALGGDRRGWRRTDA